MKTCIYVHLNVQLNDNFSIKVGARQGAVLSPLLFIIVMEALSREFKVGCPWELFYVDDLVLMAETLKYLKNSSSQSEKTISRQKGFL